jgi:hypothetical protein
MPTNDFSAKTSLFSTLYGSLFHKLLMKHFHSYGLGVKLGVSAHGVSLR